MTTNIHLLEDVLFSFRRDNDQPSPDAVVNWSNRYPHFAQQIREAAALWAEMEMQAALNQSADDEELVVEARNAALSAFQRASRAQPAAEEVRTLADAVRQVGLTAVEVGRQVSLSASVVSQILRGKIMGATIPETFTHMLARVLRREADWIRERYSSGIVAAHDVMDEDSRAPTDVTASHAAGLTFQEAVMDTNGMDEVQRRFWLEEA